MKITKGIPLICSTVLLSAISILAMDEAKIPKKVAKYMKTSEEKYEKLGKKIDRLVENIEFWTNERPITKEHSLHIFLNRDWEKELKNFKDKLKNLYHEERITLGKMPRHSSERKNMLSFFKLRRKNIKEKIKAAETAINKYHIKAINSEKFSDKQNELTEKLNLLITKIEEFIDNIPDIKIQRPDLAEKKLRDLKEEWQELEDDVYRAFRAAKSGFMERVYRAFEEIIPIKLGEAWKELEN